MTIRKSLAVWQNILLAIPVGIIGGALAGFVIGAAPDAFFIIQALVHRDPSSYKPSDLLTLGAFADVGGVIGLATFPLAYATVGRTKSVLSIVPAGLVVTVLGAWIGVGLLSGLSHWPAVQEKLGDSQILIFLLLPVIAMFGGCAWAAARERRRIAGRP